MIRSGTSERKLNSRALSTTTLHRFPFLFRLSSPHGLALTFSFAALLGPLLRFFLPPPFDNLAAASAIG
jgi:hypothetical protein